MLTLLRKKTTKTINKSKSNDKNELKITCPGCNVSYRVELIDNNFISCMDCGTRYLQRTHSNKVIDWIREKIITVGGC